VLGRGHPPKTRAYLLHALLSPARRSRRTLELSFGPHGKGAPPRSMRYTCSWPAKSLVTGTP